MELALPAALLLIAVTATSAGLYSAVKISVTSKALPEELEVATPTVQLVNGLAQVLVPLQGSQQTYKAGLVKVSGVTTDRDGSIHIGTKRYRPDETNAVDQTLSFPLTFRPWKSIAVGRCEFAKEATTCTPTDEGIYAVDASLFSSSVTATLRPRGRMVEAGTVGGSMPKSHYLRVTVWRATGTGWRGSCMLKSLHLPLEWLDGHHGSARPNGHAGNSRSRCAVLNAAEATSRGPR